MGRCGLDRLSSVSASGLSPALVSCEHGDKPVSLQNTVVIRKHKNLITSLLTSFLFFFYFVTTYFGPSGPSSGYTGAVSEAKLCTCKTIYNARNKKRHHKCKKKTMELIVLIVIHSYIENIFHEIQNNITQPN
jgi:hypothetical protein